MKRWRILSLFLGLAVLVSSLVSAAPVPNVTLDIAQGCAVNISTGAWSTPYEGVNDPCDADHDCGGLFCTTHHYCATPVNFTGHHNQSVNISVTATAFNDGAGHTLRTWVKITPDPATPLVFTEHQVGAGTWPVLVPKTWTTGDWDFDVTVGLERDGYADAAGTYTATVTVTCGGYI